MNQGQIATGEQAIWNEISEIQWMVQAILEMMMPGVTIQVTTPTRDQYQKQWFITISTVQGSTIDSYGSFGKTFIEALLKNKNCPDSIRKIHES